MDPIRLQYTPGIAGVWNFVDDGYVTSTNSGGLANTFFGNAKLGGAQLTGVVMIGWQYSGFDNTATSVVPVHLGILEQQPDGTLLLDTASYVSNRATNGGGSVIVADFNEDGRDDVFLAAHNESPFLLQPSTVLMSNAQGTFTKLTLADDVMAHDAEVFYVNGDPMVVTASFAEDYTNGRTSPSYRWTGSGFSITEGSLRISSNTGAMSLALGDLDGNGDLEMVLGDFTFGLGVPYDPATKFKIAIYDANASGTDIMGTGPKKIITPYFESRSEYANVQSAWGAAATHSYRVWLDDFNHDGRLDIVAGQSLWTTANNSWPSMLQMLQNEGSLSFEDVSDELNPDFDTGTNEVDYEMQMVDLDGSGIDSYLSAGRASVEFNGSQWVNLDERHSNWLLVNDGTGRLHVALHDEFIEMGRVAMAYANTVYGNPSVLYVDGDQATPKIHGYLNADGQLNFVAELAGFRQANNLNYSNTSVFVNIPVEVDIRADFTDAITIADRNGSMLMRTFAGHDTIHDAGANTSASIDGGLGVDTAVYSMTRPSYTLAAAGENWTVTRSGLADTLKHFERVQFSDVKLALDLDGHAGDVAKTLGAVFGPSSVDNATYVSIGLQYADGGMDAQALMGLALGARLGGGASHEAVVDLLYFNVIGAHPSPPELAYYVSLLQGGSFTQASLGVLAANTAFNLANIDFAGLAATGLAYA